MQDNKKMTNAEDERELEKKKTKKQKKSVSKECI